MTRAVAIVPLLLTAPASAQEFSCWPFKPNPPAGCRGGLCAAAAVTLCALFCAGLASADPKGLWLAQDGAHVKVGPCGGALCATIATPRSAVDPETGRPWTDKNNPDPAQRGRPLVGVPVLYSLVPDGAGRWSGRLYNIDNGNSYAGHLLELGPATIRVEGCAIGICGGQNMTRIK
jgi:uncharacterized protein (DUF2147 family)